MRLTVFSSVATIEAFDPSANDTEAFVPANLSGPSPRYLYTGPSYPAGHAYSTDPEPPEGSPKHQTTPPAAQRRPNNDPLTSHFFILTIKYLRQ